MNLICDNCKKEFEGTEIEASEILCPDCDENRDFVGGLI